MLIVDVFCGFSFGNWYFFIILHQNDTKKKMKLAPLFFTFFNSAFALQMEPPPPPNQPPPPRRSLSVAERRLPAVRHGPVASGQTQGRLTQAVPARHVRPHT